MVADVAYPFVKGGAQRRQFEVGRRLVKLGWEVHLLSYQSWQGGQNRNKYGIKYIGLGLPPPIYNRKGKRSKTPPIHFFFAILKNLWRIRHYDVIWASQWPMSHILPITLMCQYRGIPLVIDYFEVWDNDQINGSKRTKSEDKKDNKHLSFNATRGNAWEKLKILLFMVFGFTD